MDRMAPGLTRLAALFRTLCLAPLCVAAMSVGAAAQIQLVPPGAKEHSWTAELAASQAAPQTEPATAPNAAQVQPQLQTQPEPQKPAPPDFSIVDQATGMEVAPKLEQWTNELNELEQTLGAAFLSYSELDRVRTGLDEVGSAVDKFLALLTPKVEEAKAQVAHLGPAPQGGEPEPVAAQRAELQKIFGSLVAAKNIAESTRLRSSQLANKVQEMRRQKFAKRLFERVPETHSADTWQSAPSQLSYAVGKAWQILSGWWQHLDRQTDAIQILVLGILIAAATTFLSYRGVRRFRRWEEPGEPAFWRRSTSAAWVILLRLLPFAATSAFVYYSLSYQDLMPKDVSLLAYSAMRSLLIVTAVCALIATALAPARPHWRLLPMDDRAAQRIRWLVVALSATYSLTLLLDTIRYVSNAPFTLTVAQSFVSSIIIAGLVIAILFTPRNAPNVEGAPEIDWISHLRWPLWGIALTIMVTALAGYIGLARFISAQLIVTGTILAVLYLFLLWIDAVGESMADENAQLGRWLKEKAALDERRREQLALPVTLLLKSAAILFTVPLVLLQWGFDAKDIYQWANGLIFGFKVGNTQISLAGILASLVVFALGYLAARLLQGWLDRRVLATAGISGGARNSIRTAVGYVGIVLAALFAISYAGLDLSNIALVAGALSVGVGLGLQGVVNNFVSGLILLVERPIKVGDWVVVGGEEGFVKKISVRSTEIETFDRANVLIPNSYFISEKVKNWTLHNYSGRIMIPVAVHYNSDPRRVRDLLLGVAKSHPGVMTNPEPFVYFEDFGANALNFQLYAYVYDITKSLALRTDLRISIIEAFRAEAVEIPVGASPPPLGLAAQERPHQPEPQHQEQPVSGAAQSANRSLPRTGTGRSGS